MHHKTRLPNKMYLLVNLC